MSLELNDKIEWVETENIIPNSRNTNRHTKDQIERLAKIINYQGFRSPIVVSNLSGFVVAGHARLEAAQKLGLTKVPVSYQDFTDLEQEFAHLTADNAIASWAEIDMSMVNDFVKNTDFNIDFDFMGFKDFSLNKIEENTLDEKEEAEKLKKYILELEFDDESEMTEVYQDLLSQGLIVKVRNG